MSGNHGERIQAGSAQLRFPYDSHKRVEERAWIEARVMELAEHTDRESRGYTRLAFSKEDRLGRKAVSRFMKDAGLAVRVDAAGNIIGRMNGRQADAPVIMTGSHIDTVRDGGRFDGVAGVIAAIGAVRCLRSGDFPTQHPVEVVVFASEEPNEFGASTVGSRAMAGTLEKRLLVTLKNKEGLSLGEAIERVGGNAKGINEAARAKGDILAYLELHIEQGPTLDNMGILVGVVSGIAGFARGRVTVVGSADHAGTTPMNVRKDALVAAAEAIQALERVARRKDLPNAFATIGVVENYPNAANVVPGRVVMVTDVRNTEMGFIERAEHAFGEELRKISTRRGVDISFDRSNISFPVNMDTWVTGLIEESCQACGVPYHLMTSGAGHDASHMARITRAGMIFVRSRMGKSHCPEEWTDFGDIALGAEVLAATILKIDERAREVHEHG